MTPVYKTKYAAAADLFCSENTEIEPHTIRCIPTGYFLPEYLKDECKNHYIEVKPRSSLPMKTGLIDTLGGGVLDLDYTGEVFLQVYNTNNFNIYINEGERIGQCLLKKFEDCIDWEREDNQRGESGSTGK